jgi:hypothetical protein
MDGTDNPGLAFFRPSANLARADRQPICMRASILLLFLLPLTALADQFDRVLDAIALVETGETPAAVGRRGERSKFQIMPTTWAKFSQTNQRLASPDEVRIVARQVLAEIEAVHLRRGLRVDAYGLALGWNAGARARRFSKGTIDYAERVAALAGE